MTGAGAGAGAGDAAGTAGEIGYYVHHHGRGHATRAVTLAAELRARGHRVTLLGTRHPGADWDGPWVPLPRDDDGRPTDPRPGGVLHWAPRHHEGLLARSAAVSRWLAEHRPAALVSDVSQEVTLLARLHGVPVVSVVLPGRRTDAAHLAGLGVSDRLVGFWPAGADRMLPGLPRELRTRLVPVGALARFAPRDDVRAAPAAVAGRRAVLLGGAGGDAWTAADAAALRAGAPGWTVHDLGPGGADRTDDPLPLLRAADVVVTHAGQNALAEVAAVRVPAVVVPAVRPFDEQHTTADQLADGPWPALVRRSLPGADAGRALAAAAALDGSRWAGWNDGGAASRFADVVQQVAGSADPAAGTGPARPGRAA